jgi:hypothetical protein
MNSSIQPIAYSIRSAVSACGGAVSRTKMFRLIKDGEVEAVKIGRNTAILAASLQNFIARQPKANGHESTSNIVDIKL